MVRALNLFIACLWAGTIGFMALAHVGRHAATGEPAVVSLPVATAFCPAFDAVGSLQTVTYPVGPPATYAYDTRNRLLSLTWQGAGGSLARYEYTLGPTGNRLGLAETNNGTARAYTWAYDSRYRLTNETISASPAGTLAYTYDLVGNRLTRAVTGGVLTNQTLGFDSNDRLSGVGVQYDAAGNTTSDPARAYAYDWADRITNASNPSVSVWHDGDGNRIKKVAGGVTTLYLVATVNPTGYPQVVEELTVSGSVTNVARRYTYGLDLISQIQGTNGTISYYGYDGLGSVRFLVNNSGSISDTYTYDAYGTAVNSTGSTTNWYRYTGEQWDLDLGMYHLRARYLSPEYGRFWTMDSFEGNKQDPLSLHKYRYAHADPVNGIDPSGNEVEPDMARGQQVHELFYFHCVAWHGIPKYFDAEIGQVFPSMRSRLKPDVLDVNNGRRRFFELKPISYRDWPVGAAEAAAQIASYVDAMKSIPVLPGDATAEFPRTAIGNIFDPVEEKWKEVVIEASETTPGLIYYWLRNPPDDPDLEPFLIPIAIPAAQRAAQAARVLSYGGNAAAAATRAVAGRAAIQSRAVMAAMRTVGPSISARMTLTRF
jgi:RHS repeat-associated protein